MEYAVEWSAPANYRAFYELPYEKMITKMSAYKDKAAALKKN